MAPIARGGYAISSSSITHVKLPVKLNPELTCAEKAVSNVAASNIIVWPSAIRLSAGIWSAKTNISLLPGLGLGADATIFTNWNVAPPAIPPYVPPLGDIPSTEILFGIPLVSILLGTVFLFVNILPLIVRPPQ